MEVGALIERFEIVGGSRSTLKIDPLQQQISIFTDSAGTMLLLQHANSLNLLWTEASSKSANSWAACESRSSGIKFRQEDCGLNRYPRVLGGRSRMTGKLPTFETPRLRLRGLESGDEDFLIRLDSDPQVVHFIHAIPLSQRKRRAGRVWMSRRMNLPIARNRSANGWWN